jgi:hypothetical protein
MPIGPFDTREPVTARTPAAPAAPMKPSVTPVSHVLGSLVPGLQTRKRSELLWTSRR